VCVLKLSVPILFETKTETVVKDTRFIPVTIWLMHLESNYNGSFFKKSIVESALHTLKNIPILGFIKSSDKSAVDFMGHEEELVFIGDDEIEIKYLGSAYGVIPETNNARFDFRLCDDGVKREFLVVDGLMWTKFSSASKLLSDIGVKPHSMEITEDYTGAYNADNFFEFESFTFDGACILGSDVEPAMANSTIEVTKFSSFISKEYDIYNTSKQNILSESDIRILYDKIDSILHDDSHLVYTAMYNLIETVKSV